MTLKLTAQIRKDLGRKSAQVREAGKIPAVIYGHKTESFNLELAYVEFEKILKSAGESTIIDVAIDGKEPVKALISEVQFEPVKGRISHVDLHQVNMKEKIHAHVAIKFVGESRVVKEDGGIVMHNISEVEVRCLPDALVHEIEVDISVLKEFDDSVTIKDLKIPAGMEILHHEANDVVALAVAPKAEAVEAPKAEEAAPVAAETKAEEKK